MKNDSKYVSFPLSSLFPGKDLPGDIFLYLDGHFVKYMNKGDSISSKRFDQFIMKKHQFFFIAASKQNDFVMWNKKIQAEIDKRLKNAVGSKNKEMVSLANKLKDVTFDFIIGDVDDEGAKAVLEKTRVFVAKINERKTTQDYLLSMLTYDQGMADHGLNVANVATYLAIHLGYNQQLILENIYLGALLHDYGKVMINPKFFENPDARSYKQAILKHPEYGKNELLIRSDYSEEVLKIVLEHHERNDGKGYPNKIKGNKIFELTKLISISNDFDKLVRSYQGEIKLKQINAIKELESDQGKKYDPIILKKSIKAMRLVMT